MSIENNDVIRMTLTWDMPNGTIAQNVFYALFLGSSTQTDTEAYVSLIAWVVAMWEDLMNDISDSCTANNMKVDKQVTESPLVFEHVFTSPVTMPGTAVGDMMPHGVALVVRASTLAVKGLARKYIPGLAESGILDSTWSATVLAGATTFLTEWLLGTAGARANEDYFPGVIQVASGVFKALDGFGAVADLAGYQRRRKPGVGI